MSFPFEYKLTEEELQVLFSDMVIKRIAYSDIRKARKGFALIADRAMNLWPPRFIVITKRAGLFRDFVINPEDRDAFLAKLQRYLDIEGSPS